MEDECFRSLKPWMVKGFEIQNTSPDEFFSNPKVDVSVVDSPICAKVASRAMIGILLVPMGRGGEWIYSTSTGLLYLVQKYHNLSRLIVLRNDENILKPFVRTSFNQSTQSDVEQKWTAILQPLLLGNSPTYVTYESNLVYYVPRTHFSCLNKFDTAIVEDVEIDVNGAVEKRRRMRLRSVPGVLQAECRLKVLNKEMPVDISLQAVRWKHEYMVDTKFLVQPHHQAMVYGLTIISPFISNLLRNRIQVSLLSLGLGVGILESFMVIQLGFKVVGVEIEEKGFYEDMDPHFRSFPEGSSWGGVNIKSGVDAFKLIEKLAYPSEIANDDLGEICSEMPNFHIINVDITTADDKSYLGLSAPPRQFLADTFIKGTKKLLNGGGALIIHVISQDFLFYKTLVTQLTTSFKKVFKVSLDKEHEFIIVATDLPVNAELGPSGVDGNYSKIIKAFLPRTFNISEIQGPLVDGY